MIPSGFHGICIALGWFRPPTPPHGEVKPGTSSARPAWRRRSKSSGTSRSHSGASSRTASRSSAARRRVREQVRPWLPQPDQHVAAVLGGNDRGIASVPQGVRGISQVLRFERRTIAADHERGACGLERAVHARAEIAVGLARERDRKPLRELAKMRFLGSGPQAHRPGRGGACGCERPERRDQPRFGQARKRRLGEDRNRDRLNVRHSRSVWRARRDPRPGRRPGAAATSSASCAAPHAVPSAGRRSRPARRGRSAERFA